MMKFGVFALVVCVLCSCVKEGKPSNNLEGTTWSWISTTQDSTFYEDTATSANTQRMDFIDYKNMDWKRNDTVFYTGLYSLGMQVSVLTGDHEFMLKMTGTQAGLILQRNADTMWLQEDTSNGRIYKFFKN